MPSLPTAGAKPWDAQLNAFLLVGHNADGTLKGGASSGVLASRPAASAANNGSFYYATDQDVLFLSTGAAWLRLGMPAGATTVVYSAVVPTGWIAYNGTALPASTGIYADLYAALGNTTATPDTRGRTVVPLGTHADVNALGANDGAALANRTPKHNSTLSGAPAVGSLSLPDHGHVHNLSLPDHSHNILLTMGETFAAQYGSEPTWRADRSNAWYGTAGINSAPAINGSVNSVSSTPAINGAPSVGSLASGPGGTRPVDAPAYIVFSVVLAKL